MMETERKVLAWLEETGMLPAGSVVTAALSGGTDSVALLALLRALAPELGIEVRAAHFHHGLRGAEADRDEAFCRELCAGWEIPFCAGRGDAAAHAAAEKMSLEEAARALRYAFLEEVSPGLIATAHNLDDNAETMLLHLLRGTGPRGLGGIPPIRGRIVRPVLCLTRQELGDYLEALGIPHVEDSTNAADDCLRNRLRHRVLPLLRQENPRLSAALGRTAALLRAEDDYLSRLASEAEARCRAGEGWSCAALLALDPVLRRRILTARLRALGLEDPSAVYVKALEDLLSSGPSARLCLPGGRVARREYDLLLFPPAPAAPGDWELPLAVPGVTDLPGDLGRIVCSVTKNSNFSKKNLTTFVFRCDMITSGGLRVRTRRSGDRLTLSGGTKPLKDLMIDRKLPAAGRDRLPVVTLSGRPVAVFGVGADPSVVPAPQEGGDVLLLCFEPGGPRSDPDTERKK